MPQRPQQGPHQCGFPRAEVTFQEHNQTARQLRRQASPQALRRSLVG